MASLLLAGGLLVLPGAFPARAETEICVQPPQEKPTPTTTPAPAPAVPVVALQPVKPQANGTKTPETESPLRVEYFGAESVYAVGTNSVTFLCVVRNSGTTGLSEGAAKLRCLPVVGLDYTTGNLTPRLPALAPNQAIAFRWRFVPLDKSAPLIAALLVEKGDVSPPATSAGGGSSSGVATAGANALQTSSPANTPVASSPRADAGKTETASGEIPIIAPQTLLTVVPRLRSTLSNGDPTAQTGAAPESVASETEARIGNDAVALRLVRGQSAVPILLLSAREGNDWQTLAQSSALLSVYAGEEGQRPWRESLRWQTARAQNTDGEATLTITGRIGTRWRGELMFSSHRNTCVIDGKLRLKALRPTRLYSVQPPRLLATLRVPGGDVRADGSPASVPAESGLLADKANLSAWHEGLSTFGLSWPTGLRDGWQAARAGTGDISRLPVLGAQWNAPPNGELIASGEIVEIPFRIFGFAPSETLRDALRFALP